MKVLARWKTENWIASFIKGIVEVTAELQKASVVLEENESLCWMLRWWFWKSCYLLTSLWQSKAMFFIGMKYHLGLCSDKVSKASEVHICCIELCISKTAVTWKSLLVVSCLHIQIQVLKSCYWSQTDGY